MRPLGDPMAIGIRKRSPRCSTRWRWRQTARREVVRSLDYYRSQPFARQIDRVVLSGGTALCMGLDRYLRQGLGMPVLAGDAATSWVDRGGMSMAMAHGASVAIGLALDGGGAPR